MSDLVNEGYNRGYSDAMEKQANEDERVYQYNMELEERINELEKKNENLKSQVAMLREMIHKFNAETSETYAIHESCNCPRCNLWDAFNKTADAEKWVNYIKASVWDEAAEAIKGSEKHEGPRWDAKTSACRIGFIMRAVELRGEKVNWEYGAYLDQFDNTKELRGV